MLMAAVLRRPFSSPCGARTSLRDPLKWADMLDGGDDDDSDEELLSGLPLAVDDSYREAPLTALEDSRTGLNLRLASLAAPHTEARQNEATVGAPTDFDFLFRRLGASAEEVDDASSSPLNAAAPEFIPTLSHDCPIIGLAYPCEAIPEHSTVAPSLGDAVEAVPRSPRRRLVSSASSGDSVCAGTPTSQGSCFTPCSSAFQDLEFGTPIRDSSRSLDVPFVGMQSGKKKKSQCGAAKAKKRRAAAASALKSPAMKRTKSEERREAPKPMEMPELSEDTWEHRCDVRQRCIAIGKATQEYSRYCKARAADEGVEEVSGLVTPDPMDRTVSKRQWKYVTQQWRSALVRLHGLANDGGDTGSTASADEGLSIITGITDEADATSTTYGDDGSSV